MRSILETERLYLRELEQSDYEALCGILKDGEVMHAYEGAFDDREVQEWLNRQRRRYHNDGFGLWGVILKETGELIGQCGLTMQEYDGRQVMEVGYLFQKAFWHQGYAAEAASACQEYAFERFMADEVFSIIRDTNAASVRVALRNGMELRGQIVKRYRGTDMPHLVYSVKRERKVPVIGPDGGLEDEEGIRRL